MKKIFIIGAGRSSPYLIDYLIDAAQKYNWEVCVGDISLESVLARTSERPNSRAIAFDINNEEQRTREIKNADLVISMLPAFMHLQVAKDCVKYGKHLVTASYISPEIAALSEEVKNKGLIFLNEIGLDPGIDHMSAMEIIDRVKSEGGEIVSFKSYCGGLIAPESNDNPWGYKFSWNPRNVVLAGQGTAKFLKDGEYKYVPYNRIFSDIETISVDGYGNFDGYANRDSLSYRKIYGLENISTMIRGTLRMPDYCRAWNAFVKLGWTDDTYNLEISDGLTYTELLRSFLSSEGKNIKKELAVFLQEEENSKTMKMLDWLELFNDKKVRLTKATPAQVLQDLLEEKWKLKETDKDMIVMQHEFKVQSSRFKVQSLKSSLVVKGENQIHTAMAKTVGLPAAIAVKNILLGNIKTPGVIVPVSKEVYIPVMKELKTMEIDFKESVS